MKEITIEPPLAVNGPTLFHATDHEPSKFSIIESYVGVADTGVIPAGNVSKTITGFKLTSPVLVTVIVNVTSVDAAPLVGLAVFTTSMFAGVAVTYASSSSVTGSPVGV